MKWPKFHALSQQHPWLREFVIDISTRGYIDRAEDPHVAERRFQSYVRNGIQYIAFRPFTSLDLDAQNTDERHPLRSSCRFNPRTRGEQHGWTRVSYSVQFHFPDEQPYSQGRAVTWQERPGHDATSIRKLLRTLSAQETQWPCQEDKPWILDAVVRRTHRGSYMVRGTTAFDIFPFPEGFSLSQL